MCNFNRTSKFDGTSLRRLFLGRKVKLMQIFQDATGKSIQQNNSFRNRNRFQDAYWKLLFKRVVGDLTAAY